MKKWLGVVGLLFGLAVVGHAGTPQETYFQGQPPLSNTTILASSASVTSAVNLTLVISSPTVIQSGGGSFAGRNCITRFVVQVPTTTVVTIADNNTTKWTIYGAALGASGINTLSLPEDHLSPFCIAPGDQMTITLTNTAGAVVPQSVNVEGYNTYGGTMNAGAMN